jgi:NAD(P)-dependent dehydrogenase (short-subunit alcohol dehydrogenase family)
LRRGLAFLAGGVAAAMATTAVVRRLRALDLGGRVALVTGGSRGLGLLIAEELGRLGARLAIAARDPRELASASVRLRGQGIEVEPLPADVRDPAACEQLVVDTVARYGGLDVLVNNAGVIIVGPFESMQAADFEETMAVHYWAPLHLTRAALPHLRRAGEGRIVNIASIGGRMPVPHLAAYSASKFALVGLSGALGAELVGSGIAVTTVCPGLMRTGSFVHALLRGDREAEASWFGVASSLPLLTIDARRAARRIVAGCRRGDSFVGFNWNAALAMRGAGLAPGWTQALLRVAARLLPPARHAEEGPPAPLYRHPTRWVPSLLTRLGDRAAQRNQELLGDAAAYAAMPSRGGAIPS